MISLKKVIEIMDFAKVFSCWNAAFHCLSMTNEVIVSVKFCEHFNRDIK